MSDAAKHADAPAAPPATPPAPATAAAPPPAAAAPAGHAPAPKPAAPTVPPAASTSAPAPVATPAPAGAPAPSAHAPAPKPAAPPAPPAPPAAASTPVAPPKPAPPPPAVTGASATGAPVGRVPNPPPFAPAGTLQLNINMKVLALIATGMAFFILALGGMAVFMVVRMRDMSQYRVVSHVAGEDGVKVAAAKGPAGKAEPETEEAVKIGENFQKFDGKPSSLPGAWTNFRGPKFDNVGWEAVPLAEKWPVSGPPMLWEKTLGEGYAGSAVNKGRVYVMDYDVEKREDALRCFSLDDGKEIWRRSYRMKIVNFHAFSRTVPAVSDKYVVTMGPKCHVMCVDAESGDLKWGIDLVKEYGTTVPEWYTAQCPLIDGTTAVIAPSGPEVLMMGVDCETGKVLWKTPNPKNWKMSHASVMPLTLGNRKMYVYCTPKNNIMGVSAQKDDVGALLWEATLPWKPEFPVIAASPVIMEDGYLFMTTGYRAGSVLLRVTEEGGKCQAKVVWDLDEKTGLCCEQQTPIYYKKHIYSVMPDTAGGYRNQLVCMNPYDGGKILWQSGKDHQFGHFEPFLLADDKLFVMSEKGALTVVKCSTEGYQELARFQVLQGHDPWAPMSLAGGRLLVRDSKRMVCLNVNKGIEQ